MNIISLGWRCSTASSLKSIGRRCTAFPFDYLISPLPCTVSVLKRLKSPDFNMQQLLKEFLSTKKNNNCNILGFDVAHFTFRQWRAWLTSEYTQSDINISEEDILKYESMYRLNDEYCNIAHPKVYEIFERRFNRLKDMFFTQENILVYNDINLLNDRKSSKWVQCIPSLMSLNSLNRLIYITYTDREVLLPQNDNVEIHRLDKIGMNSLDGSQKALDDKIKCIFTDIN